MSAFNGPYTRLRRPLNRNDALLLADTGEGGNRGVDLLRVRNWMWANWNNSSASSTSP